MKSASLSIGLFLVLALSPAWAQQQASPVYKDASKPISSSSCRVPLGVLVCDAGDCAKKSGTHFCNQFFLAVKVIVEVRSKSTIRRDSYPVL